MLLTSLPRSICQSVDLIERDHPSRRKGSRAETSFSFPRLQPFLCHFLAQTRPPVGNKIIYPKKVCSEITPLLFTGKLFFGAQRAKAGWA